jgi:rod shape-determining protein MreC
MARMQIKVRILGRNKTRFGSVSRRMLFTWFILASFILYLFPQSFTKKFQLTFAHIFSLPLNIGENIPIPLRSQQYLEDIVPRKKYIELENYCANLQQKLLQQRREFDILYGLYNNHVGKNVEFVLGYIIPATADRSQNELTIECRGSKGLATGQFVVAHNCIIGRITEIFPQIGKAKVRLITDPASQMAVKLAGLNKVMMKGHGSNSAKILNVSTKYKIEVGQEVLAIRKPGFLDAPMIVGKVSECKPDDNNPLLWDITVEPAWNLEQLDDVAIIIINPSD